MNRHFLVRECSNTGGCIDHGLLTNCDGTDIRPVQIEDYEYYPRDQHAHDVDGQSRAPRLNTAGVARKSTCDRRDAKKREEHDVRYVVSQRCETLSLMVNHVIERLDKKPSGHHVVVLGGCCPCLLPQRFMNCIRAIN